MVKGTIWPAHALATVRARVGRLLARRHLEPADDTAAADPLTVASVTHRTSGTSPPAARVRVSSTASTSTPTSASRRTIVPASSSGAVISSGPRSLRPAVEVATGIPGASGSPPHGSRGVEWR